VRFKPGVYVQAQISVQSSGKTATFGSVVFRFLLSQMKSSSLHTCSVFDTKDIYTIVKLSCLMIDITAWKPKKETKISCSFCRWTAVPPGNTDLL